MISNTEPEEDAKGEEDAGAKSDDGQRHRLPAPPDEDHYSGYVDSVHEPGPVRASRDP
jgi:hypothetical protein